MSNRIAIFLAMFLHFPILGKNWDSSRRQELSRFFQQKQPVWSTKMHLVKWFRKNKTKVMAIVVIVILFGFVGGSYISQLGQRRRMGLHKAVARFADDRKITNYDRQLAQRELDILRMLRAEVSCCLPSGALRRN
jgi:hypothetical protein